MDKQLNKNIVFTLAYFSATKYPLTLFELWRNLFQAEGLKKQYSFYEIKEATESKHLASKIDQKDGMIFLRGSDEFVKDRSRANKFSITKLKKLKFWAKVFGVVPYVRGVFLTGTLSMKNAKQNSDWDVLVVLAKNRIWLGRLLLAVMLQLICKRRHGDKVAERFCLNHYITENALILEEHNEFSANFISSSMPILGGGIYKKFLQMNEFWIQTIKPNYKKEEISENDVESVENTVIKRKVQVFMEIVLEKTGMANLANTLTKEVMIKKIKQNPKTYWENADIRYGETALIFLPKPHRIEMLKKARQKISAL